MAGRPEFCKYLTKKVTKHGPEPSAPHHPHQNHATTVTNQDHNQSRRPPAIKTTTHHLSFLTSSLTIMQHALSTSANRTTTHHPSPYPRSSASICGSRTTAGAPASDINIATSIANPQAL
jgi:hypothetical protein